VDGSLLEEVERCEECRVLVAALVECQMVKDEEGRVRRDEKGGDVFIVRRGWNDVFGD